ncbi:heterokaryon incompatibility protein-domain-containing protein [Paraphoma chrysanthemicola]|uniref:Heterokaryon incompatibility protein-domain-containing protein n=1 Tax=Paraphoma chrysanthemicola TaxID=798071 RepID=A0A8K0VYS8_9PLEO|nr:heterokaryon incompatibility protein-domain-containing protein [Paraphoma chrysanthemicola]
MNPSLPSSDFLQLLNGNLHRSFPIRDEQIRVVDLLPGTGADAIILKCRIITLNGGRNFEALSYVWGDSHDTRTVSISGFDMEITQSLYAAFLHLRDVRNVRTLWTDQICIDQSDDEEKSRQVGLMGTIYRKCSECLIWLGDIPSNRLFLESDAQVVMDFIRTVAYDKPTFLDSHTLLLDDIDGERARSAFEALIMGGNPWWSRVWTLQEAALPATATLHWGPLTISLEIVELAALNLCSGWLFEGSSEEVQAEFHKLMSNFLYPVRGLRIARNREIPLNMLMRWRYREASDARDKVYGFGGLLPIKNLSSVPAMRNVDYRISPKVLFTNVTMDLIRSEGDLRALVGARELPHITPDLPTWTIDFAASSAIGTRQSKWWHHSHRYLRWTASKGLKLHVESLDGSGVLCLSGILIDRIEHISQVYQVTVEESIHDQTLQEVILQSRRILEERQQSCGSNLNAPYIGGGTIKDAFWRTMLGNLKMREFPTGVPKEHQEQEFEDYLDKGTYSELITSLHGHVPNHAFFTTASGYVGIGPSDIQAEDWVCIFGGGRVPFVIRATDAGTNAGSARYQLVGDAYVHGIMRGEAVVQRKEHAEMIRLV